MLKRKTLTPGPYNWQSLSMANCYQFALGYREDLWDRKLMPGDFVRHSMPDGYRYTDKQIVNLVTQDVSALGYELHKCDKDATIGSGEWMICILNCSRAEREYDFHFVVRFSTGGLWYQKFVGKQIPDVIDSPETECGNYAYNYHVVGYYKIKKVEE